MFRPARICAKCRKAVPAGLRCECSPQPRTADPGNAERARPYSTPEWKALRSQHLKTNRVCVQCGSHATVVDHIRPWKGDRRLFLDPANMQSLCRSCHSTKTASTDGGFGNPTDRPLGCDPSGRPLDPKNPWFAPS